MAYRICNYLADRVIKSPYRAITKKLSTLFGETESELETSLYHIQDLMMMWFYSSEDLYERTGRITGVPSGFRDLDSMTGGFQNSDLIIVAGWPSMGKTSFALNIAMNAATDSKKPTAIFSLEKSKEEIALRILSSKTKVNLKSLRTGPLTGQNRHDVTFALGSISDSPLWIDDTPAISISQIQAGARRLKKDRELGLIIVDYLQLVKGPAKADSREKEISDISRSLKALAKELQIPIIALSQLNRKVGERPNKRPQLADLRESGAIEQDADVIIFIYRDEVYTKSEDNPKGVKSEIIIEKHRNGPIGRAIVYFDPNYCSYRPHSPHDDMCIDDSVKPSSPPV